MTSSPCPDKKGTWLLSQSLSRTYTRRKKEVEVLSRVKGAETYMMTTSEHSTMIAVFVNRDPANQAIDNLRHAGYNYGQIRLVERGNNSFFESLKSLFTGQTTATTN